MVTKSRRLVITTILGWPTYLVIYFDFIYCVIKVKVFWINFLCLFRVEIIFSCRMSMSSYYVFMVFWM